MVAETGSARGARAQTPEGVLQHYWGYNSFRELQREIVHSVLAGHDTLGLLPTGGGKSICFQVPGLLLPGITLVITPLISLMRDQVMGLKARGIKAAMVHSGMGGDKIRQTLDNCLYGRYKFLYISPERLGSERFRSMLTELHVSLIVIDECHCISQWGYDFRPSYLNILELRAYYPEVPVLALTATATPDVVCDIRRVLGFADDAVVYQKSFYRENLSYSIRRTHDKEGMLSHILNRVSGSAIVYCRSRDLCRDMARYLSEGLSIPTTYFHAGLTHLEREERQAAWMRGDYRVMVATNAFGMGIDKPDVRIVVHLSMPSSIEEYFQEAGRAGRDGERSYAVVLVGDQDATLLRRRLSDAFPERAYIMYTYDMLCNYFGIGEGEGLDRGYDFDIDHFVQLYHMRPVQTKSALDIMALSGWLEYHDSDSSSRLMITYTREELYQNHVGHDTLLRALLRSYTGLFSDYVYISEHDLALYTGYTDDEIYGMLTALNQQGVLRYIPKQHIRRITFRIRRENTKYLYLPKSAYEQRYERMKERIEAAIRYITTDDVCRSQQLLQYFGEDSQVSCAQCDVCLTRSEEGLRSYIIEDCRRVLVDYLEGASPACRLADVVEQLPHRPNDILLAIRYLLAEELEDRLILVGDMLQRVEGSRREG